MNLENASIVAIIIGAVAVLATVVYALVRGLRIRSRLTRITDSPAFVAASELPALGERISAGIEKLQAASDRWDELAHRLTAARDASSRLQSGIDSVAACVIDLLDTFAPSLRGTASE
ncbi:MAG TPA: hypothetical protein VFO25_05015 [Candidatus Eremiobacteraceae bacterium]|nr:hypothetical protein [Candidatus Eremiobacteraceae bacterium]